MKVHELIEALRQASQEAEVFCENADETTWTVQGISIVPWRHADAAVILIGKCDGPRVPD